MKMDEYLQKAIDLYKRLNSRNSEDIDDDYKKYFAQSAHITRSTGEFLKHPEGTVVMHDGFLRVVSERKVNGKYMTVLKGEGFLYGAPAKDRARTENTELGTIDVEIKATLKSPLRGLNKRILYAFSVHDGSVGAIFHEGGRLKSLESEYESFEVSLGNKIKYVPVQRYPATLHLSTEDGVTTLPAFWGDNQKVEVWSEDINQAINFEEYDLAIRHPGVKKVEIVLNDDPSIHSKVELNTQTAYQTSGRIHDFVPKIKDESVSKGHPKY